MARTFCIHTDPYLPVFELMEHLQSLSNYRGVQLLVRHPTYFFFDAYGLCGVGATQREGRIEVSTAPFANFVDHNLAGVLLAAAAQLTEGALQDAAGAPMAGIRDGDVAAYIAEDVAWLAGLLRQDGYAQLDGPFGPYDAEAETLLPLLRQPDAWAAHYQASDRLRRQYEADFRRLDPFCFRD